MNASITTQATLRVARGAVRFGRLAPPQLPHISPWLLRWFSAYARRHLRSHFHTLRACGEAPVISPDLPLVIYVNHASWWDPLVCLELKNRFFSERTGYAPIDASMLHRYKFFARLGFFGVQQNSARGASEFLSVAGEVLRQPKTLLVITPQSRFADVRERPVTFASGIGHLAAHCDRALFLPLAVEYVFWQERFPEILIRFGDSIDTRSASAQGSRGWTSLLEERLRETQDALAEAACRRGERDFKVLLSGRAGAAGVYDGWRRMKAKFRGETFNPEHGTL